MAGADFYDGLFKRCLELTSNDPKDERVTAAWRLQAKGLLDVRKTSFVRCVNPLDRDQKWVRDPCCGGRIFVKAGLDEHDDAYRCPDCDRTVYPSSKHPEHALVVTPSEERMRQFVTAMVQEVEPTAVERPRGMWLVLGEHAQAQVCLADCCEDASVFTSEAARRGEILFVIGNDRDLAPRLPPVATRFRLTELALDSRMPFAAALRQLLRPRNEVVPAAYLAPIAATPVPIPEASNPDLALGSDGCWQDLTFVYNDGESVSVRRAGRRPVLLTCHELGLALSRSSAPSEAWKLVVDLCEHEGLIPYETLSVPQATQRQVTNLRQALG